MAKCLFQLVCNFYLELQQKTEKNLPLKNARHFIIDLLTAEVAIIWVTRDDLGNKIKSDHQYLRENESCSIWNRIEEVLP